MDGGGWMLSLVHPPSLPAYQLIITKFHVSFMHAARAKNVAFVLDKRQCCTQKGLLGEAMRPFTGPALLQ